MGTLVMEVRSDTPCMMLVVHKPTSERLSGGRACVAAPSLPDVFLPSRFLMLLRCSSLLRRFRHRRRSRSFRDAITAAAVGCSFVIIASPRDVLFRCVLVLRRIFLFHPSPLARSLSSLICQILIAPPSFPPDGKLQLL